MSNETEWMNLEDINRSWNPKRRIHIHETSLPLRHSIYLFVHRHIAMNFWWQSAGPLGSLDRSGCPLSFNPARRLPTLELLYLALSVTFHPKICMQLILCAQLGLSSNTVYIDVGPKSKLLWNMSLKHLRVWIFRLWVLDYTNILKSKNILNQKYFWT